MIKFLRGNIFETEASALVCPVNCVGSMGGGLAKQFRNRSRDLETIYQSMCNAGRLEPGQLVVLGEAGQLPDLEERPLLELSGQRKAVWLLATKDDWRHPSRLEWVDQGLQSMAEFAKEHDVESIALPAIGCGLGGLRWRDVKYLVEKYFAEVDEFLEDLGAPPCTLWVYEPSANGPARRRGGRSTREAPRASRKPSLQRSKDDWGKDT